MKIAMILKREMREQTFSKKSMEKLKEFGEVIINDTESTDDDQVKKIIKDADIAITSWGSEFLTKEIIDEAPNLKLIIHAAGSVKPIVTDDVWEKGIRVTGSPKPLGHGVAETALGFSISGSKNFFYLSKNIANGGWKEGYDDIKELVDITVGVVGAGWAGKHYIDLMNNFDVDVVLYDPFVSEEKAKEMNVKKVDFETLLKISDIVSIHAPSIPETNHMFNESTLKLMKKDTVLINTARGSLIDENALYEHMKAGNIKYACLDVTDPEPPLVDNPLRKLENVIFTPHLAGLSNNGKKKIGIHVCEEIQRFIDGEKLVCEVTKEMLANMA